MNHCSILSQRELIDCGQHYRVVEVLPLDVTAGITNSIQTC